MPQPTHRDLKKFCDYDSWDPKKRTDHWRYLQVSEEEFWRVVREGGPARHTELPVIAPDAPPLLSAVTVLQLRKLGVSLQQVRRLRSQAEAEQLLARLRGVR